MPTGRVALHLGETHHQRQSDHALRRNPARLVAALLTAWGLSACSLTPTQDGAGADATPTTAHQVSTQRGRQPRPLTPLAPEGNLRRVTLLAGEEPRYCAPDTGLAWYDDDFSDVWERIRAGLSLDHRPGEARIAAEITWFGSHQEYINKVTNRAGLYLHYVVEQIERHGYPMEIALLPIVESSYDPFAFSQGQAAGMWQFIASTGKLYGLKQNWWYDGRRDVRASTDAAIAYLGHLVDHFGGDWELALAAYNTGQGNVDRAIRRNQQLGKPTDFWSLKLPKETSAYVPRLLAVSRIVARPHAYGVTLDAIPNEAYFAAVDIGSQIDMAEAARLADTSTEELYQLNPGFNQWATDPRGPFELLVPADKAAAFAQQLGAASSANRVRWQTYRVVAGDTLTTIARRHSTDVQAIARANALSGTTIHPGQQLMIPPARGTLTASSSTAKPTRVSYQVQPGDTLWRLSQRFKVSVEEIAQWNQLSPDAPLRTGATLSLLAQPGAAPPHRSASADIPAPFIRKVGYTVRRGDSLSQIASKFNVKLNDILRWNPSHKTRPIAPGQRLTLFVDITKFN